MTQGSRASAVAWYGLAGTLLQLNLLVGHMLRRTERSGRLRHREYGVVFDSCAVGVLDGAQAGGYPGFAGGDGLAVAAAVGVFGEGLAVELDFANMGFAFVGVGGDGEDGGAGGGGVEDEGNGLAFGVAAGQGDGSGLVDFRPLLLGVGSAVSGAVVEAFEQGVGAGCRCGLGNPVAGRIDDGGAEGYGDQVGGR